MNKKTYRLFFKTISNNTRFEIIQLLRKGSKNVNDIAKNTGFEQSRVSHSLKCLETCGFVNSKSDGNQRIYELDKKHILPILSESDKHIKTYSKRLKSCRC